MTDPIYAMAAVLAVLQIKHFICDFALQTSYQLRNKGIYLHPGGLLHAGSHALCTMAAFLIVVPTLALGAAIVVGEFLVHYHIDWLKEQILDHTGWTQTQPRFWWAIGVDQFLHQLTYIVIATVLLAAA